MDKQLQGLLDEIRNGGVHDSVGSFSLDRFSAARKLARTQFPSPYYYAIKLVQWAVASHAKSVRISIWPTSVDVTHDGRPIGDKLPELVRFALSSPIGPDRNLVHLASAILAMQALNPSKIQVWSQGRCLQVAGDDDRVVSAEKHKAERVKVSGLGVRWGAHTSEVMGLVRPEVDLLYRHAGFSEIPVYLNGVPLSRPFLGIRQYTPRIVKGVTRLYIPAGGNLPLRVALAPYDVTTAISVPGPETAGVFPQGRWWMRAQAHDFTPLGMPRTPVHAPSQAVRMEHLTLADFPMYRGWAILLDYRGNFEHRLTAAFRSNSLRLIQDGALIEMVTPLLEDQKLMAEGIVATGSLPLDLSHFRYVRNDELNSLVQEVGRFLELSR